ncbi:MAG: O-antigen ligase family protein [Ardenticatenaceae bacterium]|nr:O-antigen ligase family protein [Ardenticatenaceae bacterium]
MRKIAFWLALVLLFMIPWENSVIIDGVGRISRVMGILVAAFWLGTVIATGKFRQLRPFHIVIFIYFFWNGITILWSTDVSATLDRITTYIQLLGFAWLLWDLFTTKEAVHAGLQMFVLGAYVSVIDTISNYFAGISRGSTPRYAASGFNANGIALIIALTLPMAWYLATSVTENESRGRKLLNLANYLFIPLGVFAVLLTASRTALIVMVPTFWFILGTSARLRFVDRILISCFLAGALYFLQPLIPQTSLDRLSTTQTEFTEGDLSGRRVIWAEALVTFETRPLIGTGSGTFKAAVDYKDKSAHNTYLAILIESGAIGLGLFVLVALTSALHLKDLPRTERMFYLTLLIILGVGITTMSWEIKKPTWFILTMVMVHAAVFIKPVSIMAKAPPWRKPTTTLVTE